MTPAVRLGLAVAALVIAAGAGVVSVDRTRTSLAVLEACEAVESGDVARALALTEGRTGAGDTGRAASECRCSALLASGDEAACADLLERVLTDSGSRDWAPRPDLARWLIQTWRDRGRGEDAARLARRAGRAHPEDAPLFALELEARASVETEADVMRELAARIPVSGESAARMRVSLAQRHLHRGDARAALNTLGEQPPAGAGAASGLWFDTRGIAHALDDDPAGAFRAYEAWHQAGGVPAELRARRALALSIAGLSEPGLTPVAMLEDALAAAAAHGDPGLHEALVIRLILTLVNDEQREEALVVYDREVERFALEGLSREELLRSTLHQDLAHTAASERLGTLRFEVSDAPRGSVLWVSPEVDAPADARYERIPLTRSGRADVTRAAGIAPQRWVLRDVSGSALASGTIAPRPGATRSIPVRIGSPVETAAVRLHRGIGDGRRRVALVVLDCADWRISQYLRARGELPVFDALLASGHRAVLDSDPPLTAAALEALVWPRRRSDASTLGTIHQLGVELSGLASVGDNPLDFLAWVLPESPDLFSVVGAGERTAANLLLAHGGIRAGRHGELTGPRGQRRRLPVGRSTRDLSPEERERWPALSNPDSPRDAHHVGSIAAELDAAVEILRAGEVDLLALRVEALDLITHAHFAGTVRDGQDDGEGFLYSVYRYIDARLAEVDAALDADDVLIAMSDHGIRTAMEHSRDAIFVAVGGGVPPGRAPGRPALRGVSRSVADLLGVASDWPETGVAPWISASRTLAVGPHGPDVASGRGSRAAHPGDL